MNKNELISLGEKILKNSNILSFRLDSEVILSNVLNITREKLLIEEFNISDREIDKFKSLIARRSRSEPIAYIFKKKEFRSVDLFVDNKDDFVILCGVSNGKVKEYFILPTLVVDKTLKESNRIYHLGKKRDGSKRKVTSHRAIFLQESKDHYSCGWRRKWNRFLNNWDILEK